MTTLSINRARSSNAFSTMAQSLVQRKPAPVFKCLDQNAEMKYSEPQQIVAVQYNETTREIRVVGSDTNVRVCKIDRLPSIEFARELFTTLKTVKNAQTDICFQAAGNFSPDKWFCDIVKA